ncbi:MAG: hypothetical protein IKF83_02145 [Clostridia bacterium]|nr:hypothetical protein [Clostridia bacterium]
MLVSEVKPIGKVGKKLLENKKAEEIINTIIEKPLQKACKACLEKNIETSMSSANRKNIVKKGKKSVKRADVLELMKQEKTQTFLQAGKGYAWIMINYNTLSDENRKILFSLEETLGEDTIWFIKSCYVEFMNKIRKPFRLKPMVENFDDMYADKFKERQLILMYNNKYPRRAVFIRMPIDENTTDKEVETYFDGIISRLVKQ